MYFAMLVLVANIAFSFHRMDKINESIQKAALLNGGRLDIRRFSALVFGDTAKQKKHKKRTGKEATRRKTKRERAHRRRTAARKEAARYKVVTRSELKKVIEGDGIVYTLSPRIRDHLEAMNTRKCSRCGKVKDLVRFECTRTKTGYSTKCIPCRRLRDYYSDPVHYFAKHLTSASRDRASAKGLPFDIDEDFVMQLYRDQDGRCALCGRRVTLFNHTEPGGAVRGWQIHLRNMSLDQIVPGHGYTTSNVQIVDRGCNFSKRNMQDEEFINMCRYVVLRHGPEAPPDIYDLGEPIVSDRSAEEVLSSNMSNGV
mmetsp:Transcript_8585/g.15727  ORF Transcript_8585/g.15727 Transcript_8585/m.15727 type:complete len:313 (+) Transcript_8585:2628-3566(+)